MATFGRQVIINRGKRNPHRHVMKWGGYRSPLAKNKAAYPVWREAGEA